MRRVQLDYQRNRRPLPWMGLAVLLPALAVFAGVVVHGRSADAQAAALEAKVQRLQGVRAAPRTRASPARAQAQAQEVQQANQVVRELTLPWGALFKAVDAAGSKDVALLMLEPDLRKGTVRLSGEARDLAALLAYVRTLAQGEGLAGVLLESHQVRHDEADKPVRFALVARWKEPAP